MAISRVVAADSDVESVANGVKVQAGSPVWQIRVQGSVPV